MRTPASLAVLLVCAAACSRAPQPPETAADIDTSSTGSERAQPEHPLGTDRMLDEHATFADLVRNARALASRRVGLNGDEGLPRCLLRRTAPQGPVELLADVMPALDPTPDPPSMLGSRFDDASGTFDVLTGWGVASQQGASAELLLAAFTTTAPESLHAQRSLLALVAEGAYVRSGPQPSASAQPMPMPMPIDAALREVVALTNHRGSVLYITAEATLPVSQIVTVLEQLPPAQPVALAVLLPEGTALPPRSVPAGDDTTLACPNGLPEAPADAALGDLDPSQLGGFRAELHGFGERCLVATGALAPVTSVRVTLAIRLGDDGAPMAACVMRSEPSTLEPELARCLTQSARALGPATLTAKGLIDLHVPLTLNAERPSPLTAGCARE